jgi:hypothetical protein
MSNLIQILILSLVEAIVVFKFIRLPRSLILFLGLILLQIGLIGFFFSPHRSPTLRTDFERVGPYLDAVVEAQNNLSAVLDNKIELADKLDGFNQKLAIFEGAFPNPHQDIQDQSCRDWYLTSLAKFKLYSQVASQLSKPPAVDDKTGATQLVEKLNSADEAQKLQAQLVGIRIASLEKSGVQSIFVGFLTWLRLPSTN